LRRFLSGEGRRVVRQLGGREPESCPHSQADPRAEMAALGVEHAGPLELHLRTGTGTRIVRIEAGGCAAAAAATEPDQGPAPGLPAAGGWRALVVGSQPDAPWLEGMDRLGDPAACSRFVVSRILYRRLGRFVWWLFVPFVVVLLLRLGVTPWLIGHAGSGFPGRALRHARAADLGDQIAVAILVAAVGVVVLSVVLWLLSRRVWSALGGGTLDAVQSDAATNDTARDAARRLVGDGADGLITASTFEPELTHLGVGFFANVGASTGVTEEHRGRLGLPPVFVATEQVSWIELETGAELHVRLMLGRRDLPSPSRLEAFATRGRVAGDLRPQLVASHPAGGSWPPPPDLRQAHRRTRRVRRWAAAAILVAGVIDLLDAVTPPLRNRLHIVLEYLPLRASEAAGALVAVAGLGLVALGRGILRGQNRAWRVAVALLAGTVVLHLAAGGDVEESLIALAVLALLVTNRREFQSSSDWASLRNALIALGVGWVGMALLAVGSLELVVHLHHHHHMHLPITTAWEAVSERMLGIQTIPLPGRANRFLAPALLAIGLTVVALALFLLTRPVVDRRLRSGRAAELRARDIVRRHGSSTLDYFALRSDKRWFFHRDTLVAYAVHGGICLISPDPIGPANERSQTWAAFRRYADRHGWVTAVMGAGEEWLPVYRESGMHHVYLGDEALVHVQDFALAGRAMKGLRQAHHRVARRGYTVSFHDPSRLDGGTVSELVELMDKSRQGEHERGFSMMLGRIFDHRDTGLLLTVVRGPDGLPAAMCQFVPAPGIEGYSLDLMRRDPAEHPNGLLDFALCETIGHLRARGCDGVSLNFAALRSTVAAERGDGTMQRAGGWLLKRLSSLGQIESLWRFNAKYEPEWIPRYVVFDTAEHLLPVVMAILRAESIWEVPVLGRFIAASTGRRNAAARARDAEEWQQAAEPVATDGGGAARPTGMAQDAEVAGRP
ncbi:MAG TPA: phosphatidylglycerol lysyltransferase domain-containing protein, partial [Acidimicrobiales bacterium]|nr:phosphatidylglycerol lysyltransferase domain-containing protein [Acidimicrobiales bacterium]